MSVTYAATLPVRQETVVFLSGLLHAERQRLGTRAGTRALGCFQQAILVLRWLLDGTRVTQVAADNEISRSTGYAYLHEGITVLAAQAPGLHSVLLAAKMAGYAHVCIDGTLIETDRCRTPGPKPGVDLWWSGKHDNHGGNVLADVTGLSSRRILEALTGDERDVHRLAELSFGAARKKTPALVEALDGALTLEMDRRA